ncbi:hypothetical protein [Ureibacillus manganicus]|nr:hypothetical protein [Ureibacillus manganicus]
MSNRFKKEIEKIDIPKNLHESVQKGIQRAKQENQNSEPQTITSKRQFKPYFVSLIAVALIGILLFPAFQSLNSEKEPSHGSIVKEQFTDGDYELTKDMHEMISDYIIEQSQHQYESTDAQFEVHKVYGTLQEGDTLTVFLWSFYNRFNLETRDEVVSGASRPVTITLEREGGEYKVIDYKEPEDGSLFVESIENMFPDRYVEEALKQPSNMEQLFEQMKEKVNVWLEDEESGSNQNTTNPESESTIFDLRSEEAKAYYEFQQDLNTDHLYGLSPINIARLYIFAGYEKKYDVQYALYTDREEYIMWSKEEHIEIPESERGSFELYRNIEEGTFIETSDHTGYIKFFIEGELMGFQMIKNEDGIWQVSFMPLQ